MKKEALFERLIASLKEDDLSYEVAIIDLIDHYRTKSDEELYEELCESHLMLVGGGNMAKVKKNVAIAFEEAGKGTIHNFLLNLMIDSIPQMTPANETVRRVLEKIEGIGPDSGRVHEALFAVASYETVKALPALKALAIQRPSFH